MLPLLTVAFAGSLGLSASSPAVLRVDGETVPLFDAGPAWLELSPDQLHVIEARTTSDRPIATLELMTPDGIEVRVEWRGRSFAVTGITATSPSAVSVHAGAGGVAVDVGALVGSRGTQIRLDPGQPLPPVAPPPVAAGPVVVELLPKGTDWCNVWIDGEKVAEFRVGDTKKLVSLSPGVHTVEVRDFMESDVWLKGQLVVSGPGPVKFGFEEGLGEVYTDPAAWRPVR